MGTEKKGGMGRTIWINILVLFVMANVIYWAIPAFSAVSDLVRHSGIRITKKSLPPPLGNFDWANTYQTELRALTTRYVAYLGWRRGEFTGKEINIVGPYDQRKTVNDGTKGDKKVYFFGGSTMWGEGSNDPGTIPSQYAAATGVRSENFGETAYTAHQSLVLLIQLLQDGHRPDLVVFYDGVNDVTFKCEANNNIHSTAYERLFRKQLDTRSNSFAYYWAPVDRMIQKVNRSISRLMKRPRHRHNCDKNPEKAEAVAESLIKDWEFARMLVEAHGGKFVAVLQPVVYTNSSDRVRKRGPRSLGNQFDTVYPLIRKNMAGKSYLADVSDALNAEPRVYIDFCHVTPPGNRAIAQRIAAITAPLGFGRPAQSTELKTSP